MPYIHQEKNKLDEKYFGRYLIFNEQLIGIRVCTYRTSQNPYTNSVIQRWPAGKMINHKPHKLILDYYKDRQNKERKEGKQVKQLIFKKEIPVGDFILNFNNAKIGLLFESEYREDNHILNHLKRAGCQIISVVSDLPRDKMTHSALQGSNYKTNSAFETALKKFCRSTDRIIMYSGVRMAPLGELYLSLSFVLQKELVQKATQPHMFNDGGSITTICTLPRITQTERRDGTIEEVGFHEAYIGESLVGATNMRIGKAEYRTAFSNRPIEPKPITRQFTDIYRKLSIWYLFKEINQGEPLAFIVPLTNKTRTMVYDIKAIAKYIDTRPEQMVVLIKTNKYYVSQNDDQEYGKNIHYDIQSYCAKFPNRKLYFYTDEESQIKFLTEKAVSNPNIRLCHKLMPFEHPTPVNKLLEERLRRMDRFAEKIISDRIINFESIIIESKDPVWNFTREDILQAIQNHLKLKLRIQIRQHPFFISLLRKEKSQIQIQLRAVEEQLFKNNDSSIYQLWEKFNQEKDKDVIEIEDQNDLKEREEKERQFWSKMKEQRKMRKQQQKKIYVTCHRCNSFIEKPCVLRCRKCDFMTCFMCIELFHPDKIKSKNDFLQNCIVCSDACKCQGCKKRSEKTTLANSRVQSHPSLTMMEEEKEGERERENHEETIYKESCTACMIMGRTSMNIKVYCDKCDKFSCILCIRDREKNTNFMKEWLCQDCRPPEPPKLFSDSFIPVEPIQNGMKENISKRASQKSPSRSGSPQRQSNNNRMEEERPATNGYNNDRNNWNNNGDGFRGRGRGRGRGGNFNYNPNFRNDSNGYNRNNNSNSNNNQTTQNEKRSASRSNSPVRNVTRKSPSNSASPPRVVNNNFKKAENRKRSASRSNSPVINRNKSKEQNKKRSPSHSVSPPRNNKKAAEKSPPKFQRRKRSRSNSNSATPPKKKQEDDNKKKGDRKRHSSPSRSKSPVRNKPNGNRKKSNSRSRSRSNEKKQEKHFQKPLWNSNKNGSKDNNKNGNSYSNGNNDRPAFIRNGSGNGNGNYRGSNNNNFSNNSREDKGRPYEDNRRDNKVPGQIIPMNNNHIEEENDIDY